MNKEIKNGIILAVSIILILIITYFTTAVFFTGEIGDKEDKKTTTTKSSGITSLYNNMIIASKTFDRPEDEYMVLFFSQKNASEDLKNTISNYDSSQNDIKLYKVNTDEAINKYVVSNSFNGNAETATDIKIVNQALIIIRGGKMVSYEIMEKDIVSKLK